MSDGYTITPASRRSVAGFRRTLARPESALHICPPDCKVDHDAGKSPGRDHWTPRKLRSAPKRRQ